MNETTKSRVIFCVTIFVYSFCFCHSSQHSISLSPSFKVVKSCLGSLCTSLENFCCFLFSKKAKSIAHLSFNMLQLVKPFGESLRAPRLCIPPFWSPSNRSICFPFQSSEIVFRMSVGPSHFQLKKNRIQWPKMLENVVIIAYTHTYAEAPLQ